MAYVYNPFTFGLDYTDRRILAPLEANIANLVIMTSANETRSIQNRTRLTKLQNANTVIWPKVFVDHESRIEALEDTDVLNHAPRITDLETSNTTLWEEIFDYQKPMFGVYGNRIDYIKDKTTEISRAGERGQINVLQADSSYATRPEWIIFEGHFTANTNNEVAVITTNLAVTLEDVFDTWERFAFGTNGSQTAQSNINAFQFNVYGNGDGLPANTISCLMNTTHDVGFISDVETDHYELEVHFSVDPGKDSDNDRVGIIMAYNKDTSDPTNEKHQYLVAARNQENNWSWRLVAQEAENISSVSLGYISTTWGRADLTKAPLIIDKSDVVPRYPGNPSGQGSAWSGGVGTVVRVIREGDLFKIYSSQYNSMTIDPASEIVIDLNDAALSPIVGGVGTPLSEAQCDVLGFDNVGGVDDTIYNGLRTAYVSGPDFSILEKFKGPKKYGFMCMSQTWTTFDVLRFENYSSSRAENFVFDLTEDKVWVPDLDTGTYKHATASNLESELGRGRIIRDKTSNDVFYFNKDAQIVPLFRPGTIDHLTVQVETLMSLMSNTANQVANLYANIIHGTQLL
ncbi:MAG: hypothetical protein VW270_00345 [Candidatus Poseidoniales archaeon]